MINETDTSRKETLIALLQFHHVVKSKFDRQATMWLTTAKVDNTQIQTLLAGVRTTLQSCSWFKLSAHSVPVFLFQNCPEVMFVLPKPTLQKRLHVYNS